MNPVIVTVIIAVGAFIVSIFGASWLNQQAMNRRIDDLKSFIDARFEAVNAQFEAVNNRISSLEQRVERIERQLDQIFKPSLPRT